MAAASGTIFPYQHRKGLDRCQRQSNRGKGCQSSESGPTSEQALIQRPLGGGRQKPVNWFSDEACLCRASSRRISQLAVRRIRNCGLGAASRVSNLKSPALFLDQFDRQLLWHNLPRFDSTRGLAHSNC
jgi:hypothetical protein